MNGAQSVFQGLDYMIRLDGVFVYVSLFDFVPDLAKLIYFLGKNLNLNKEGLNGRVPVVKITRLE